MYLPTYQQLGGTSPLKQKKNLARKYGCRGCASASASILCSAPAPMHVEGDDVQALYNVGKVPHCHCHLTRYWTFKPCKALTTLFLGKRPLLDASEQTRCMPRPSS